MVERLGVSRIREGLMRGVNRALRPTRLRLIPAWQLDRLARFHDTFGLASPQDQPVDPALADYLDSRCRRLDELRGQYREIGLHASAWDHDRVSTSLDLRCFRSDNMFLFQGRGIATFQYLESARYVRSADRLGLADRLEEDGAFGAQVVDVDGWKVSRDLLDSILEINFIDEVLGIAAVEAPVILDIGAGYGRLAHRMSEGLPNLARYLCTDGVPESTFLQEFYLSYRDAGAGEVVALTDVDELGPSDGILVAVNVHSFPEMPMATSAWWIDQIARCQVPNVFIASDYVARTTALEADGRRHGDFTDHLTRHGYRLVVDRPKYDDASIPRDYQLYPAHYWFFERT